jgi:glycosyltransferase involved in cell wall biosynthesis
MQRATRKPVLIATHGLDPVGTGRQVELLAHGLAAAGRDVHVACTTTGGALPERLAAAGIAVHRLGRRPQADAGVAVRMVGLARRLRAGAVISFGRRQAVIAAAVRLMTPGVRALAHVAVPVHGARLGWSLRRMDRVITTSPGVAASCQRLGVSALRIATIAPGIVADQGLGLSRGELARLLGLDPAATWTLCVTPLVAESRLERLLWGIDQLGVVRKGVQHVLLGAGPQLRRVWRRARVQELAERLFVMPHCGLVADLLGQVSYVWQPAGTACGGAILDAMARGVPAVAVESEAARQLIVTGETGWIVPPLPESEFPRRAFTLLENAEMAAEFGAAAQARAAAAFPVESMLTAFGRVLDELA